MIFERGRHTFYDFFLYNTEIEIVNTFKYLGILLTKSGNWNQTQKRIAQHASRSLSNVFTVFNQITLPLKNKIELFDSLVSPILNFSAEVWGTHSSPEVEAIHSKFCRKLLGVKLSTNREALYGELGRFPMWLSRHIIILKYWVKILKSDRESILYKSYLNIKTDMEQGNHYNNANWAYKIKNILDSNELGFIWQYQDTINIDFGALKFQLLRMFKQKWYHTINNSNRLETYGLIKYDLEMEKYLTFIKESKFRIALTRFRVSSHNLRIEEGRYENIQRNERICQNCNNNQIENEYHFLLICPKHQTLRNTYLPKFYFTWPTIQKFISLLSSNNKKVLLNLSKFIYYANNMRN
jgi:hypothetical protein